MFKFIGSTNCETVEPSLVLFRGGFSNPSIPMLFVVSGRDEAATSPWCVLALHSSLPISHKVAYALEKFSSSCEDAIEESSPFLYVISELWIGVTHLRDVYRVCEKRSLCLL